MSAGDRSSRRIRKGHVYGGVTHVCRRGLNFVLHQDGRTGVGFILTSRSEKREQNQRKNGSECRNAGHYAAEPAAASFGVQTHVQLAVCGSPSGGNMW